MRLSRFAILPALCLVALPCARAEYVVLQNGERLHINGYQREGDSYILQVTGGTVRVAVTDVAAIEREEVFTAIPKPQAAVCARPKPPPAVHRQKIDRRPGRPGHGHGLELLASEPE